MNLKALAITALIALLVGAGIGWKVTDWIAAKAQVAALKDQHAADQKAMDQRVADEQAAVASTQAKLQQEQDRTKALNDQLAARQGTIDSLKDQIAHAHFTSKVVAAIAGQCPGHPVSSPEFLQLYNAAAQAATRADSPTADASRVSDDLF